MRKIDIFISIIFFLLIVLVFKSWFFLNPLSSGDWSFNFNESIKTFVMFPHSWNFNLNAGLGGTSFFILPLSSYFLFTTSFLFNIFKLPWVLIERLVWFWPFLILSIFSSYFLFKNLFSSRFALLSSFIYLFNTYILMLVGGGQMGVALSYSLVPLVLYSFIKIINRLITNCELQILLKKSIVSGLLLALQVMFDPRIAYITMIAVGLYWFLSLFLLVRQNLIAASKIKNQKSKIKNTTQNLKIALMSFVWVFGIPIMTASLLHAFWILPLLIYHQNPLQQLGPSYSTAGAVQYFSFAKFEDAIALLHPNWPENMFGKTYFIRPEFLVLPILAYISLLFIRIRDPKSKRSLGSLGAASFPPGRWISLAPGESTLVIYFVFLSLLGAFLAKGVNEPFGEIYLWMFAKIPGFIMFRDPTKWYTLVAISYSILIPFAVWNIYEWIKSHSEILILNSKFSTRSKILNLQNLFLLIIVFCLLYLIRPALFGQLTGTFKSKPIPKEYISLEKYISKDNSFYRTFWIPKIQRFAFYSKNHPAVSSMDFLKESDYSRIIENFRKPEFHGVAQDLSIKYLIVPYDSEGEIFLTDRNYDERLYKKTIEELRKINWLKEIKGFGKIAVFEISSPKGHFWSPSDGLKISYEYINPTKYILSVKNAKKNDLIVFSENFDKYWIAYNSKFRIKSSEFKVDLSTKLNSFRLPIDGSFNLEVYYTPQDWVNKGLVVGTISFVGIIAILIGFRFKK